MSEPTEERLKSMVVTFLTEYNLTSQTKYHWDDKKSYVANSKNLKWADAIVFSDTKKVLYLQHKEVVWNVLYDKIRSRDSYAVVKELKQSLAANGFNDCSVHFNFDSTIPKGNETREFVFYAVELVRMKLDGDVNQNIKFRYDKLDDIYLDKIKKYVSYFDILKWPKNKSPVVGWGYSEFQPRPLPHYGDVVVFEINKQKQKSYDGVILLMESTTILDGIDIQDIEKGLSGSEVKTEVWIVEDFISQKRATRLIKPNPISTMANEKGSAFNRSGY